MPNMAIAPILHRICRFPTALVALVGLAMGVGGALRPEPALAQAGPAASVVVDPGTGREGISEPDVPIEAAISEPGLASRRVGSGREPGEQALARPSARSARSRWAVHPDLLQPALPPGCSQHDALTRAGAYSSFATSLPPPSLPA